MIKGFKMFILFAVIAFNASIASENSNLQTQETSQIKDEIIVPTKIVENFFNQLNTFEAKFIQIDNKNNQYNGVLTLKKVGKIRLEYTSGIPITVAVKDNIITYYDAKREQISHISTEKTMVSLLTKRVFLFTDPDVKLINQSQTDETITIQFEKTSMPEEGSFVFIFKRTNKNKPISAINLDLAEIKVIAQSGEITTLKILKTAYNKTVDDSKFIIKNAKTQIDNKFKE